MKIKIQTIVSTLLLLLVFFNCSEDSMLTDRKMESGDLKSNASSDVPVSPMLFGASKWFTFFPRSVAADRYNVQWGLDGITWPWLANCSGLMFFPDFIRTAHVNNTLYMLYFYQGSYWLKTSTDGINWSAEQAQGIIVSQDANGNKRHPELAAINGELYAFQFREYNSVMTIHKYKYSGSGTGFNTLGSLSTVSDIPTYVISTPSFTQVNGKYFLFASSGGTLFSIYSTDIVNWTVGAEYPTSTDPQTEAEAQFFNGKIYVTYMDPSDYIRYRKFHDDNNDGIWAWDNTQYYVNVARSSGKNVPLQTDGTRLWVNYRGVGGNDYNYFAVTSTGNDGVSGWAVTKMGGSSLGGHYRELIYTGN